MLGDLYRYRITKVSDASDPLNIDADVLNPQWSWDVVRCSVENETTDYTKLRIGIVSGDVFHPLEEEVNVEGGEGGASAGGANASNGDQRMLSPNTEMPVGTSSA